MKLHRRQAGLVRDGCDLPGVARVRRLRRARRGRKMRCDCGHLRGRDLARAGRKDEADGVRAKLGGELRRLRGWCCRRSLPTWHRPHRSGTALVRGGGERGGGVGLAHQRLADEKGVVSRAAQLSDVGGGADAAFGDMNGVAGKPLRRDRTGSAARPAWCAGCGC